MKSNIAFLLIFFALSSLSKAVAQDEDHVTYEELYDDPENINKLFVGLSPIIGDLWATNPNVGFGVDATYFLNNVAQFRLSARKAYGERFEIARYGAILNSDMDNSIQVFNYYEIGGTYHIKDFIEDSQTKMVLYKKSYKGARWTARVPLQTSVPSKVRKIYGARFGSIFYDTSVDLNRIMDRQGISNGEIISTEGLILPQNITNNQGLTREVRAFSNMRSVGFYLGGSITWIRNVAVDFDKHEPGVDDQILTTFADILIMPWTKLDNLFYQSQEFLVDPVKMNPIGFRLGVDGKFNRTLSWGYGGEFGYRPGLQKGGFTAMIKVSLPIYGTNLDDSVEAFGK